MASNGHMQYGVKMLKALAFVPCVKVTLAYNLVIDHLAESQEVCYFTFWGLPFVLSASIKPGNVFFCYFFNVQYYWLRLVQDVLYVYRFWLMCITGGGFFQS